MYGLAIMSNTFMVAFDKNLKDNHWLNELIINAPHQGGFIVLYAWEIEVTISKSYNIWKLPFSSILYIDFLKYSENQDK